MAPYALFLSLMISFLLGLPAGHTDSRFVVQSKLAMQSSLLLRQSVTIIHGNFYASNPRTGALVKYATSGQKVFDSLQPPPNERLRNILALAEDSSGNVYITDGIHIHIFSFDGKFKQTINPGLNLGRNGLVAVSPDEIYVTGRVPMTCGPSPGSIFAIRNAKVAQAFSKAFFPEATGVEDGLLNSHSSLALDRKRGLLYQLPEYRYEIRVYRQSGEVVATIIPPSEYLTKQPKIQREGAAAGLDPSDDLYEIAVLPDGGFVVEGMLLDQVTRTPPNNTIVTHKTFVDFYDTKGRFVERLLGEGLQLPGGAEFLDFDLSDGEFYFLDQASVYRAAIFR